MARIDSVAARYAKAIYDSLSGDGKDGKVRSALKELEQFVSATSEHEELNRILSSAVFPTEQRRSIVEDIATKMKISADTKKILVVLAEMKRLAQLATIVDRLQLMLLHSADVIPLRVETATDLNADEKDRVEKKFSKLLGKKVEARYIVEPALLAGLRVTANGRTFDGTISGWLSEFEERLAEGSR